MPIKVLILGASGMLGHKLYIIFQNSFETFGTIRGHIKEYAKYHFFQNDKVFEEINAFEIDKIKKVIELITPDVIINCIGIIKQIDLARNPRIIIETNSLFPHKLADLACQFNFKLIQISTDCVFSGKKGNYAEVDVSDAEDLYGRTKFLGEVLSKNALTIRTSIIGREINKTNGLLEWFLSQEGKTVKGFVNVIFSGFTTEFLARELIRIIKDYPYLEGLYHISSCPISKYGLLQLIKRILNCYIEIEPDNSLHCERSLNSEKYRNDTNFVPPTWEQMISALRRDTSLYSKWRKL